MTDTPAEIERLRVLGEEVYEAFCDDGRWDQNILAMGRWLDGKLNKARRKGWIEAMAWVRARGMWPHNDNLRIANDIFAEADRRYPEPTP